MAQRHRDRAARSHRTHDGGDHLILLEGLVVTHSDNHIPESNQLEVTTVVLGTLLRSRVPLLTVDLHDDTCPHQQVHSSYAGNPHLRGDPEPCVVQYEPDE